MDKILFKKMYLSQYRIYTVVIFRLFSQYIDEIFGSATVQSFFVVVVIYTE